MDLLCSLSTRQHKPGRLLLHGCECQEHGGAEQQRPRAWLAVAVATAGGERDAAGRATVCLASPSSSGSSPGNSGAEPSSSGGGGGGQPGPPAPPSSGGSQGGGPSPSHDGGSEPGGSGSSSSQPGSAGPLGGLVAALQDAGRLVGDPAFAEVPVPTIYLGGLPAPIPAGRPTINAATLLHQLQQGVLPSDSLPEADREVWRAASRITDPISAFNISQAQQLAGRKLLLTERGVAEGLARGTIQMVPCERRQRRPGGGLWWNPLAPLLGLASRLADGRQLSKSVQERAAALDKAAGGRAASKDAAGSSSLAGPGAPQAAQPGPSTSASAPGSAAGDPASSSASSPGPADQPSDEAEQQYCLEDVPVRRILAGGAPPQLAWVPLRVALAMLHDLPQHFMLLQGALQGPKQQRPKQRQQQQGTAAEGRHKGRAGQHAQPGGAVQQPTAFATVSSPAGMEVFVLPGLSVRQLTPDGGSVEFVPAFLSASQAQELLRQMQEMSGGAMLAYRRFERASMRRRLEAAAAMIASGGAGGGASASGSMQEEDEGGMEDPPEINDFIRELGGSLAQEAGAAPAGGLSIPSGLPGLAATFACGVTSVVAGALCAVGDAVDWVMMATPLGPRLLGVPESSVERHSLAHLLTSMQGYNREQAVLAACFGPAPPLSAQAQARSQQAALPAPPSQQEAGPAAAAEGSRAAAGVGMGSDASSTGNSSGQAAEQRERNAAAALHYSRTLAAAALYLAISAKGLAEDPRVGGASLGRMLAKAFVSARGMELGRHSVQQAAPALSALPDAAAQPPPDLQEAVTGMLASGLPVLEKNGFEHLWACASGGRSSGSSTSSSTARGSATLAAEVARCCTGDTSLGLGVFVKDGASNSFTLLGSALGPLPAGRGLVLVGDLNRAPRRHGRTSGRTSAYFLTTAVDDGSKLL